MSYRDFDGYSRRAKIGDGIGEKFTDSGRALFWVAFAAVGVLSVLGCVGFILHLARHSGYARTLSGVGPTSGEITLLSGDFINVVPNPVNSQIFIHSTGVGTINGMSPPVNGDITIAGGTAIGVVNTPGTGTVTVNNEGVTSLIAGNGVSLSGTTGDVTVYDELDFQSGFASNHPFSPHLQYGHSFVNALENDWTVGYGGTFSTTLVPGINPGNGGQGNGVTTWTVPAIGEYDISIGCQFTVSGVAGTDFNRIIMAVNLGASTVDPNLSGYVVPGAFSQVDFSTPQPLGAFPFYASGSGTFHAGCVGCPVSIGDAVTIHTLFQRAGPGGNQTYDTTCGFTISRQK